MQMRKLPKNRTTNGSLCHMRGRRGLLPAADTLCVDQIMVYALHCPVPDAVHSLYPQHLILSLELFGYFLQFCHLFCQQEHLLRYLFIDIGQIGIQSAAGQKLRVQGAALSLDVPQVPLSPKGKPLAGAATLAFSLRRRWLGKARSDKAETCPSRLLKAASLRRVSRGRRF